MEKISSTAMIRLLGGKEGHLLPRVRGVPPGEDGQVVQPPGVRGGQGQEGPIGKVEVELKQGGGGGGGVEEGEGAQDEVGEVAGLHYVRQLGAPRAVPLQLEVHGHHPRGPHPRRAHPVQHPQHPTHARPPGGVHGVLGVLLRVLVAPHGRGVQDTGQAGHIRSQGGTHQVHYQGDKHRQYNKKLGHVLRFQKHRWRVGEGRRERERMG